MNRNTSSEHSIQIVLPPKSGYENVKNEDKMDVCALTLACLAQDPNLPSSKLPFAWKLYEMLETVHRNEVDTEIVSWVDEGEAFKIHDVERFVEDIVPKYFKQSKYKSFQRQLYFYGFTRTSAAAKRGQTVGSYRHPNFVRGKKTLCLSMQPKKSKKRKTSSKDSPSSDSTSSDCNASRQRQNGYATHRLKNDVINGINNDDTTPIPLTYQTANYDAKSTGILNRERANVYRDHQAKKSSYFRQQIQLQKLQREQFLHLLGDQQSSWSEHGQSNSEQRIRQQHRLDADDQPCSVFGGMTFHSVRKRRSLRDQQNHDV